MEFIGEWIVSIWMYIERVVSNTTKNILDKNQTDLVCLTNLNSKFLIDPTAVDSHFRNV